MNYLTKILIWAAIIGALFGVLWWQGHVRRLVAYFQEMWVELQKCSWPTWIELRGSTTVIIVTIVLLGTLTYAADMTFNYVFLKLIY